MFKSKRSNSSSQISPLAPPPPASTQPRQPPSQPQMNDFGNLQRVTSGANDSISSRSDKRRSGFFGLGGKKDKDKDKEKDKEKLVAQSIQDRTRQSFSIDRSHPNTNADTNIRNTNPGKMGPPQAGMGGQQRVVSSPLNGQGQTQAEFGSGGMPKSQSMSMGMTGSGGSSGGYGGMNQMGMNRNGGGSPLGQSQVQGQRITPSQGQGIDPYRNDTSPNSNFRPPQSNSPLSQHSQPQRSPSANLPRSQSIPLNDSPKVESETMNGLPTFRGPGGGMRTSSTSSSLSALGGGLDQGKMRQFEGIVELIGMQPQKTYVACPPEIEMILARTSAGGQPKQGQPGSANNDWDSVWLQLSGISLSMWSMKETRAAAAKGDKVPPTYFNITDSSLELLAPLPPPPHRPQSHPHHFVFSLNTAGSNRLLFSCPSEKDLAKWTTGLRLAAWERARLEEIYTGHLIKSGGREPKSELVRGRMEGWVRVRVMGGTDWKRLWVVISTPTPGGGNADVDKDDEKKNRRKSFFGLGGGEKEAELIQEPNTGVAMASFYSEPRTIKNKTIPPVLTITNITQAYAVFPERLEVMSQSNLMKVVGKIGGEAVTIEGRLRDSGWALIMPESAQDPTGSPSATPSSPLTNMMRWVTGFHDAFGLYGRPERYNWDQEDPKSLFFAYPQAGQRSLFLELDEAIASDFRSTHLATIRSQFATILQRKLHAPAQEYREEGDSTPPRVEGDYRLPPLSFGDASPHPSSHAGTGPRSLTPITERTDIASRTNSTRTAKSNFLYNSERKLSDGPTKQASGNSMRHENERLAPISDSTEAIALFSEEPESAISPEDVVGKGVTRSSTMEGSKTAETEWSQDSPGVTPTGPLSRKTSLSQNPTPPAVQTLHAPQVNSTIPSQDRSVHSPAPSGTRSIYSPIQPAPSGLDPGRSVYSPAQPPPLAAQQSVSRDRNLPSLSPPSPPRVAPILPLAAPVAPRIDHDPHLHSPTPRKGSMGNEAAHNGSPLHEEPAALYLMNMVDDEPQISPPLQRPEPTKTSPSRPTIVTSFEDATSQHLKQATTEHLGRKPSGARAPPPKKTSGPRPLEAIDDQPSNELQLEQAHQRLSTSTTQTDLGDDAGAFVAYADHVSPAKPKAGLRPAETLPSQPEEARSSFAPSRAAAERRAKQDAAEVEVQRAKNVPGGGRRAAVRDTWSGSDEDEDEEDHEQVSPPSLARSALPAIPNAQQPTPEGHVGRVVSQTRALPAIPQAQTRPNATRVDTRDYGRSPAPMATPFYTPGIERPQSRSPVPAQYQQQHQQQQQQQQQYNRQSQAYPQQQQPYQQSAPQQPPRQTLWNANFSAEHGMDPAANRSSKFVDLDQPSAQLTKAFAPHGLLQAGIQDKEDRSAKRQEEVAREMGSSLVNVPSKPPPPQTGLLGAVAAHEKERKNAGGIGATLTDREREKRQAEDRQREIEKLQRQQMEHMRQFGGGDMGGLYPPAPYGYGMPPGMPPMMGMPPMGYSPYQGGYNPYAQQHAMMAAQMAYQQAMMMSQAGGSVNGAQSPDRPASPAGSGYGFPPPQMASMYGWQGGAPPWGSPSPSQMGSPWLRPQGYEGDDRDRDREARSRVASSTSEVPNGNVPNGHGQGFGQQGQGQGQGYGSAS